MCKPTFLNLLLAALIGAALSLATPLALAQNSGLDVTFSGGRVGTDFNGGDDGAYALILQPDGKLVAAGHAAAWDLFGRKDFALVRYQPSGLRDPSFGTDGRVTTNFSQGDEDIESVARALVLQPDGKLVAAGYAGGDVALVRYNADGSLDASFGTAGVVTGPHGAARALVLQPDGKLVAAGSALMRYNADGSLDASFGSGGIIEVVANALVLLPDGKLVTIGDELRRFNADGTPDTSFGTNGVAMTNIAARALVFQPDGKLVAAGGGGDFALARYNTDGSPDPSFGTNGHVTTDFDEGDDRANALILQPDGKLVAAGTAYSHAVVEDRDYLETDNFALARYNADGSLDGSFGRNGRVMTHFSHGDEANALVLQPDGKLVAAGRVLVYFGVDYFFGLARYLPGDVTRPVCGPITAEWDGPNNALSAIVTTVSDFESGIASVTFTSLSNLIVEVNGGYAASDGDEGSTYVTPDPNPDSVSIRGERISYATGGRLVVTVANGAGLTTRCDPVITQLAAVTPEAFALEAAYPNPARLGADEAVRIAFAVAEATPVRIAVYDLLGREVLRLADSPMEPGRYEVTWDGTDGAGHALSAGVYFYRMDAGAFSHTLRMTLVH